MNIQALAKQRFFVANLSYMKVKNQKLSQSALVVVLPSDTGFFCSCGVLLIGLLAALET